MIDFRTGQEMIPHYRNMAEEGVRLTFQFRVGNLFSSSDSQQSGADELRQRQRASVTGGRERARNNFMPSLNLPGEIAVASNIEAPVA